MNSLVSRPRSDTTPLLFTELSPEDGENGAARGREQSRQHGRWHACTAPSAELRIGRPRPLVGEGRETR